MKTLPLAGVVAGALAVSEVFQHALGSNTAACRDTGLSLWCPDLPWQSSEAVGPALQRLPTGVWLLGLGHLGQASAWSLGCLPYSKPDDLEVYLVDFDTVVQANHSTGLLTLPADIGQRKTRIVASRLEQLGHLTRLIERPFDDHLRPSNAEPPSRRHSGSRVRRCHSRCSFRCRPPPPPTRRSSLRDPKCRPPQP